MATASNRGAFTIVALMESAHTPIAAAVRSEFKAADLQALQPPTPGVIVLLRKLGEAVAPGAKAPGGGGAKVPGGGAAPPAQKGAGKQQPKKGGK